MEKMLRELFSDFLKNAGPVFDYRNLHGIFTVCLHANMTTDFVMRFTHWNETHGIPFSLVKINDSTFIVYSGNGVKITDLTNDTINGRKLK